MQPNSFVVWKVNVIKRQAKNINTKKSTEKRADYIK